MPSVIATLKVQEDKVDETKSLFARLAKDCVANEEGTLTYTPHQLRGEPSTFIFYEKYADDAALAEHSKNLAAVGKEFASVLAGAPEIHVVEEI